MRAIASARSITSNPNLIMMSKLKSNSSVPKMQLKSNYISSKNIVVKKPQVGSSKTMASDHLNNFRLANNRAKTTVNLQDDLKANSIGDD